MPIFYIDPVNGNDTTGVGSQATPWKTIEAGATAARIAPGDEIRIAKSPDPASLGTITFTNDSAIATLATARTMEIDNCESAWSPATNITCNTVNNQYYYCQGTKGAWMQPGSSFATGVMAWKTLATATDFSAFEKISFFLRTNYNYAANSLRLDLCSDADGRVPVNSFALVTYAATGNNQYHVYDNGGPLGSGIRSIAIRALTDPGTNSVYIDNIIATNDISHHTPIGKNDGFWYPIKSISGATIELGYDTSSIVYKGTTATGAGYYQETNVIGAGANPLRCQESGSAGNITLYRGGWNFTSATQDGVTWYSAQHYHEVDGPSSYAKSYVEFQNFGMVRGDNVFYIQNNANTDRVSFKNTYAAGGGEGRMFGSYSQSYRCMDCELKGDNYWVMNDSTGYGFYLHYSVGNMKVNGNVFIHAGKSAYSHPAYMAGSKNFAFNGNLNILSVGSLCPGVELDNGSYYFKYIELKNLAKGISTGNGGPVWAEIAELKADTVTAGFYFGAYYFSFVRVGCLDLVAGNFTATWASTIHGDDQFGYIDRFDADNRWKALGYRGTISDQITGGQVEAWAYGGSGTCLYFDPSSQTNPLVHKFYIPVEASKNYKVHFWVKKTAAGADCTMTADIHGCGADITEEAVALTDAWVEYQSSTFTTDMDGFVIVRLKAYDGAVTGDIGVDSIHLEEV